MNKSALSSRYFMGLLTLISLWLGWTVLTDFFIVPKVFAVIKDFFNAGELGIVVFSRLNILEVITGSALVSLTAIMTLKEKKNLIYLIFSVALLAIALTYFAYLSPKIQELTELWKKADQLGSMSIAGIDDIQQEHQKYHRLYVSIDTAKLILLVSMWALGFKRAT